MFGNLGFQSFIDKMLAAENEGQVWMMLVRLLSDQIQDESFGLNSAMEAMDQIYGHNAGNLNVLEWFRTDNFKLFSSINYVTNLSVLYEYIKRDEFTLGSDNLTLSIGMFHNSPYLRYEILDLLDNGCAPLKKMTY